MDQPGRLGVDQPNYGSIRYPLLQQHAVNAVLEDIHISWISNSEPVISLKQIAGIAQPVGDHGTDLQLLSSSGQQFHTSSMSHTVRTWVDDLKVHVWRNDFVVIQAVIRHDPAFETTYVLDAELDPRAVECLPASVSNLLVRQSEGYVSGKRDDQAYRLAEGYNCRLTGSAVTSERYEKISVLTIGSHPGSGEGQFPACDKNAGITSLGGSMPSADGDLLFSGDSCLHVRPALKWSGSGVEVIDGAFELIDACSAPCSCDDITQVMNFTTSTWSKFKVLGERVAGIQQGYSDLRNDVVAKQEEVANNPLRVHVWDAAPCAIGIGAGLSNVSDKKIQNVTVTIALKDEFGATVAIRLDRSTAYRVEYKNGSPYNKVIDFTTAGSTFTFDLGDIEVDQMAYIYIRVELGYCQQQGTVQVSVPTAPTGWKPIEPITAEFDYSSRSV